MKTPAERRRADAERWMDDYLDPVPAVGMTPRPAVLPETGEKTRKPAAGAGLSGPTNGGGRDG